MDNDHIHIILRQQCAIWGNYQITSDGVVNVDGDVIIKHDVQQLQVQFGEVQGHIKRDHNFPHTLLKSLQGFPRKVGEMVSVARSQIKDLTHAPNQVGGTFYAYGCPHLTSLHGSPRWVGGDFKVYNCALTSLQGAPLVVKGVFEVRGNPLENYDHVPEGCASVIVPYNKSAPILKLLQYPEVTFTWDGVTKQAHPAVDAIMRTYAGQSRSGAIKAATELIKAGYKENARW